MKKIFLTLAAALACACGRGSQEPAPAPEEAGAQTGAALISTAPPSGAELLAAPGNYVKRTVGQAAIAEKAAGLYEDAAADHARIPEGD